MLPLTNRHLADRAAVKKKDGGEYNKRRLVRRCNRERGRQRERERERERSSHFSQILFWLEPPLFDAFTIYQPVYRIILKGNPILIVN